MARNQVAGFSRRHIRPDTLAGTGLSPPWPGSTRQHPHVGTLARTVNGRCIVLRRRESRPSGQYGADRIANEIVATGAVGNGVRHAIAYPTATLDIHQVLAAK